MRYFILIAGLAFLLSSCHSKGEKHGGVADSLPETGTSPPAVSQLNTVPYGDRTITITDEAGKLIQVAARKEKIENFDCQNCHQEPIESTAIKDLQTLKQAHWKITLQHPDQGNASCTTCHDSANPVRLKLHNGTTVDFDQSFQLCEQCHFRQKNDWLNGAHGKRLTGWAGDRVIENCTGCHNPHDPAFKERIPVIHVSLPKKNL